MLAGHCGHRHGAVLVANFTYFLRRGETVYGNRVALGAGNILLLRVDQVPCGISYLLPFSITAFMAFRAAFIVYTGMFADSLRLVQTKLNELLCPFDNGCLMA